MGRWSTVRGARPTADGKWHPSRRNPRVAGAESPNSADKWHPTRRNPRVAGAESPNSAGNRTLSRRNTVVVGAYRRQVAPFAAKPQGCRRGGNADAGSHPSQRRGGRRYAATRSGVGMDADAGSRRSGRRYAATRSDVGMNADAGSRRSGRRYAATRSGVGMDAAAGSRRSGRRYAATRSDVGMNADAGSRRRPASSLFAVLVVGAARRVRAGPPRGRAARAVAAGASAAGHGR